MRLLDFFPAEMAETNKALDMHWVRPRLFQINLNFLELDVLKVVYDLINGSFNHSTRMRETYWPPPSVVCFKMNVDAIINTDARVACIGVVIRNCRCEVKVAISKKIIVLFPQKVAEAKALGLSQSQECWLKSPPCGVGYIDSCVSPQIWLFWSL